VKLPKGTLESLLAILSMPALAIVVGFSPSTSMFRGVARTSLDFFHVQWFRVGFGDHPQGLWMPLDAAAALTEPSKVCICW